MNCLRAAAGDRPLHVAVRRRSGGVEDERRVIVRVRDLDDRQEAAFGVTTQSDGAEPGTPDG